MDFLVKNKQLGTVAVKISDEDVDLVIRAWHLAGGKGAVGRYVCDSGGLYLHRLVAVRMGLLPSIKVQPGMRGKWSQSIDHINGDKLDNRRSNLRLRDRPQQMRNSNDGVRSTNKSGYRGVSYVKRRERFGKPWMAYVTVNYKTKNLGWYATVEEAAAARQAWEIQRQE